MAASLIPAFSGKYRFLSNFHRCGIQSGGIDFTSVEAAYQAGKTLSRVKKLAMSEMTPAQAKRAGRLINPIRPDWDDIKVDVMTRLVRQKFLKHMTLGAKLLETGTAELVEGNDWGDVFWGVCNGKGLNTLGRILMEVRAELKENEKRIKGV